MIPTMERNGPKGFHAFRVLFLPSHDTHSTSFYTLFYSPSTLLHLSLFGGFSVIENQIPVNFSPQFQIHRVKVNHRVKTQSKPVFKIRSLTFPWESNINRQVAWV
jgi:hypothetical protein